MKRRTRSRNTVLATACATIEKMSHDGRGIARIDGKTTFISGALPEEVVVFQYTRRKSDFDEGRIVSIETASPHRVAPICPHYDACGGCSLQHLDPVSQIQEKQAVLLDLLINSAHVQPLRILPPLQLQNPWHYRNKARLSVRFVEKKQAALVGFREKHNPRYITEITQCPVLHESVDNNLLNLRQLLDSFTNPHNIAQIEVAAGDDAVALIFRNLEELCNEDAEKLQQFAIASGFKIFLQPGGPDSVVLFYPHDASDYLSYEFRAQNIKFNFHPTDFTQVNTELNQQMVNQALELLNLQPEDVVLDLFCGLGNFSLPIAKQCARVVGVEGSAGMVARATMNAELNNITNATFQCANLEDENCLANKNLPVINKMLLDPPRTGAINIVKNIEKQNPRLVVYVSCNPSTLARDAGILVHEKGYKLTAVGVIDLFPHTAHVESIALFEKN